MLINGLGKRPSELPQQTGAELSVSLWIFIFYFLEGGTWGRGIGCFLSWGPLLLDVGYNSTAFCFRTSRVDTSLRGSSTTLLWAGQAQCSCYSLASQGVCLWYIVMIFLISIRWRHSNATKLKSHRLLDSAPAFPLIWPHSRDRGRPVLVTEFIVKARVWNGHHCSLFHPPPLQKKPR